MSEAAQKFTSEDLKTAIRARFAPPGFQTFFEVSNDTGMRIKTYADAVSIGIWPSSGHVIHGFEVKVSRSDWLNELKNPGKSMPIFKHCDRWSLVCPAGLVAASELPSTWGMFHFNGTALREVVKPPKLTPEAPTAGFMAALARRAGEADSTIIAAAVKKAEALMRARQDEDVKRRVDRALEDHRNAGEADRKLGSKIAATFGEARAFGWFDDEAFCAAVRMVMACGVGASYGSMTSIANQLRQQAERIDKALSPTPLANDVDVLQTSSDCL